MSWVNWKYRKVIFFSFQKLCGATTNCNEIISAVLKLNSYIKKEAFNWRQKLVICVMSIQKKSSKAYKI